MFLGKIANILICRQRCVFCSIQHHGKNSTKFLHFLHTQLYLPTCFVDSGHADPHPIPDAHDLRRVAHEFVRHLGYMHESVVLESYVHERTERHDIANYSLKYIPFLHILHRDLFLGLGVSGARPLLDSRVFERLQYKVHRVLVRVLVELLESRFVGFEVGGINPIFLDVFREFVLVWVDVGIIERFRTLRNSQEPDGELVRLF